MSARELIARGIRVNVRDMVGGILLRDIESMWEAEGFPPPPSIDPVGGQRVTLYESYLRQVDWTSSAQVERAKRVLQETLIYIWENWDSENSDFRDRQFAKLRRQVQREGLRISNDWLIEPRVVLSITAEEIRKIEDPGSIYIHLERLSRGFRDDDPESVIGQSKELIETTAKLILEGVGEEYDSKADFNQLVKSAQKSLGLNDGNPQASPDSLQATRQILNGAQRVANGLAELRNKYGTGHGPGKARTGLEPRHAQLAVNAARLWCELMLATYASDSAPWRASFAQVKGLFRFWGA